MQPFPAPFEADDVALLQLLLALGRAQGGAAAKDDHPLLVRVVGVVRPEAVARLELVQASAQELGADLRPYPRVLAPPALALLDAIPLVSIQIEDVHGASLGGQATQRDVDGGSLGPRDVVLAVG